MRYRQVQVIGGSGGGPDKFASTLRGLCIDRHDRLYAASDSEVKMFDAGGVLRRRWGTSRPASAVAVADDGTVYAGEPGQIEVFNNAGKVAATWRDEGRLGEVTAIGFFRDSVLAADVRDRSIHRYDRTGALLSHIGKNSRVRGFLVPNGVLDFDVDERGVIHAANPGKHRVERYTCDGELLGHIGRFDGQDPSGFGGCCNPTNVAVGTAGRIYVTEKAGPRAKVLDPDGGLIAVIATSVFDPNCKNMSIAVDSRWRVYVADTVKLAIFVFEPVEEVAP